MAQASGRLPDECVDRRDSRRLTVELVMLLGAAFFVAGVSVNDRRVWDGSVKDVRPVGVPTSAPEAEPEPARELDQA